ncbi:MAG TPA: hypothetical protein VGG38_14440 [Acidimicrobiales bacterium]|jgi:hypothetical protein
MTIAPAPPDEAALVKMLLAMAGVPATEEEIELVISQYARLKGMIDVLYAVEEARYESPALHFTATPTYAEWG